MVFGNNNKINNNNNNINNNNDDYDARCEGSSEGCWGAGWDGRKM